MKSHKKNIDPEKTVRHIQTILSSFQPKHEHKIAGCAYLRSQFLMKHSEHFILVTDTSRFPKSSPP